MIAFAFLSFWSIFWLSEWITDDVEKSGTITSLCFSLYISFCSIFNMSEPDVSWFCVLWGYFLWDLIICAMFLDVFGFGMLFHAFISLVSAIAGSIWCPQHVVALLCFEISTVFLDLVKLNAFPKFKFCLMLLFGITFVSIRTVWGTYYVVYHIFPEGVALVNALSIVMMSLNYFWTYRILRRVIYL